MTAPDPGLTDLLAAHRLWFNSRDGAGCYGCGWRSDVPPSEGLENLHHAHVTLVVEQHTNGRITELEAAVVRVEKALEAAEKSVPDDWGVTYIYTSHLRAALEGEQQ